MHAGDSFYCNVCQRGQELASGRYQHIFTHPLVRCKERVDDPEEPVPLTTDDRLASLEQRVGAIDNKLDRLQDQLEMMFMRMEERLLSSLSPLPGVPAERKRVQS